ncbi:MAG: ABC transporter permease [Oligoflexia bacterium]|nr:ABC transporter permease [Oligoflexia bacterium]
MLFQVTGRSNIFFKRSFILCAFATFGIYFILILSLFYFLNSSTFFNLLLSYRTLYSLVLSLIAASLATILSIAIGVPAAYALSRYNFYGKEFVDTILELPMVVSPAALGAMLLIFFNNPIGLWINEHLINFVFTIAGVVLAQFITTMGIATRLIKTVIDEIPQRYENVARGLGATPLKAFMMITLPLSKRGIISASILTWAKAFGEFGATITIAGSMPANTETLPIAVFMRLSAADIEGTVVMILILTAIGLGILYIYKFFAKRFPYV